MADDPMHDWKILVTRLLLAVVAGGVIGWERAQAGKPAGTRTHMLIALGAAFFVMAANDSDGGQGRAVQGVAAGIGFLGAGEIVHRTIGKGGDVFPSNLTSAAAIWVAAGAGVAAGVGLWELLVVGTVLALITLSVVRFLDPTKEGERIAKQADQQAGDPDTRAEGSSWKRADSRDGAKL